MIPHRVLLVHNRYKQAGGEDAVFAFESALLRRHGHEVIEYLEDNRRVDALSAPALALNAIWSRDAAHRLRAIIRRQKPDIVHFHNTFVMISPAAYRVCKEFSLPVVKTLHNYRLACPEAAFVRDGRRCEECVGRPLPWPGILHACYHSSQVQAAGVAAIVAVHRLLRTWRRCIDVYIALTNFARGMHIKGGLPAERIMVKPNSVVADDSGNGKRGDYALYVGRLTPEKGIRYLLEAWRNTRAQVPLKIVGEGPLAPDVAQASRELPGVESLGYRDPASVRLLMRQARFLVMPSVAPENFPITLAEAFSAGLPAVVSARGAMREIVEDGQTGLHFRPEDPRDLAAKVSWLALRPAEIARMSANARKTFQEKYSPEKNYELLMHIYRTAIKRARDCQQ